MAEYVVHRRAKRSGSFISLPGPFREHKMSKKYRILASMLRSGPFTVASLAEASGENLHTVRTVLQRCNAYFSVSGTHPTQTGRGGKWKVYEVSAQGVARIKAELSEAFGTLPPDHLDAAPAQAEAPPLLLSAAAEQIDALKEISREGPGFVFLVEKARKYLDLAKREIGERSPDSKAEESLLSLQQRLAAYQIASGPAATVAADGALPAAFAGLAAARHLKPHRAAGQRYAAAVLDGGAGAHNARVFREVSSSLNIIRGTMADALNGRLLIGSAMDDEPSRDLATFFQGGFNAILDTRAAVKKIDSSWFEQLENIPEKESVCLFLTVNSGGERKDLQEAIERIQEVSTRGVKVIVLDNADPHPQQFENVGILPDRYFPQAGDAIRVDLLKLLAQTVE
jgi:predicted ArsR family transcriptional regulator